MSFKIQQGLFTPDFVDHHAVLGVSVDATTKDIRKRYLKIARRLHPDSSDLKTEEDRKHAGELLSKLVNPAYEYLSQEKNYSEYLVLLKLKGQQAQRQQETVILGSDVARQLAGSPNVDQAYLTALKDLAEQQYHTLAETLGLIGTISELNLVYLMRKAGSGAAVGAAPAGQKAASTPGQPARPGATAAKTPTPPPSKDTLLDSFIRRAEECERKQDYAKAILELREALKLKPDNANCHSRLGMIYLRTKQPTMAKIHFNKALELDPKDEIAQAGRRSVEQAMGGKNTNTRSSSKPGAKPDKPGQSGGGLFGLFGGRKK
jgi:curved DNA-binding protein CbpA